MSWNARDRVKWLLSSRFRQNLTARRVREAEVRRLRLNIDARMFVREIYHQQLYENDELRLKPEPFAYTARRQLDEALSHAPTEIDPQVARALLEHALAERARWIIDASFTADQLQHGASDPPSVDRYEFKIQIDDQPGLGNVTYRVCTRCQQGVLDNITVAAEIGCGGVGRRALDELQQRWVGYKFNTTGQRSTARGFYDRCRMTSSSPWLYELNGCPHLAVTYSGSGYRGVETYGINTYLMRWARRKYKRLRAFKRFRWSARARRRPAR